MSQINDLMAEGLEILGFPGNDLPEQLADFKEANAPWTGWDDYLTAQGVADGNLSDRKFEYFEGLL
jgi:hypothetical protein